MIAIEDIRSLTDFQRNAKTYAKHLNKTGRPMVLTVNGKPGIVVQDAKSYQKLLRKLIDQVEMNKTRQSIIDSLNGKGRPAEEVFEEIRKKYNIPHSKTDSCKLSQGSFEHKKD